MVWPMRTLALALMMTCAVSQAQVQPAPATRPAEQSAKPPLPPKPKPTPSEELWLYPAQRISADLESQSWRLRHDLHAIAMATLGAAWWKQDRSAAEHWIYPAVDEVTLTSENEPLVDRNRRLEAARRLLSLVTPLDVILRERVKDIVKNAVEHVTEHGPGVRWQTADALVEATENSPPSEVAGSISEALQYTVTSSTVTAIGSLRGSMPAEAERLFSRALSRAVSSNDPEEMRAFMPLLEDSETPALWRQQVANAYARALTNGSLDSTRRCVLASESAGSAEEVGPEVQQAIAAASAECMSGISDPALAADAEALKRADPQTSDDYVAVAGQSRSPTSRFNLKLTAAEKAEKEDVDNDSGGPVRALRILDAMTPEERAVRPGEYTRRRAEEAIRAALHSGCQNGLRVIDSSPRETIFHVATGVAEKVDDRCVSSVVDIAMRQMRRNPPNDPNDYIRLMNVVLRRHLPETTYRVQDILRGMDEWKAKDARLLLAGDVTYEAPWNKLWPMQIAKELFDLHADWLTAVARGSFRNDLLRADFELLLVRGFLDRYAREVAKKKAEMAAETEKP